MCWIGPAGRDIGVDGLERQHLASGRVQGGSAIADGPARIRLIDPAPEQGAIERNELSWIWAVEHNAFQGGERLSLVRRCHGHQSCRSAIGYADGPVGSLLRAPSRRSVRVTALL